MEGKVSWSEKYRPVKLDEFVFKDKDMIKTIIEGRNEIFSIILSGPYGTGKGSLIKVLKTEMKKNSPMGIDFVEFNSSLNRGIDVIREINERLNFNTLSYEEKRVFFFNECDKITEEAQKSLKGVIEKSPKNNLFIFATNHIEKVYDGIRSRAIELPLENHPPELILKRLKEICNFENVKYDIKTLKTIIKDCKGDIRKTFDLTQFHSIGNKDRKLIYKSKNKSSNLPSNLKDYIWNTKIRKGKILSVADYCDKHNISPFELIKIINNSSAIASTNNEREITKLFVEYTEILEKKTDAKHIFQKFLLEFDEILNND